MFEISETVPLPERPMLLIRFVDLRWVNILVLAVAVGMIFSAIVAIPAVSAKLGMTDNQALVYAAGILSSSAPSLSRPMRRRSPTTASGAIRIFPARPWRSSSMWRRRAAFLPTSLTI
jgi:hypothetical protein